MSAFDFGLGWEERWGAWLESIRGVCSPDERPFTARQLADGRAIVLQPDGLTWEPEFWPAFESAERHAARLNEWAAARPSGDELVPLLGDRAPLLTGREVLEESPEALGDRLVAIIDRLQLRPERKLDALAATIRGWAAR